MDVIRADAIGMCFGVRDALAAVRALEDAASTTIFGELVHNEEVRRELAGRGFRQLDEDRRDEAIATRQVLVTAHGIADRERERLAAAGHALVDTTCPLVARAHRTAKELAAEGRHVVVLGRREHVEVRGLVGDLASWRVVSGIGDVAAWPFARLGVLCQTTMQEVEAQRLLAAIRVANPYADIAFRDTICEPTKQRIRALAALLPRVDAVVVVGGRHSNNTKQLAAAVARAGVRAIHVQGPDDVDAALLAGCGTVGLTAGTSTRDATIDAVERALQALPSAPVAAREGA